MNKSRHALTLEEGKIQATILLKSLRSRESKTAAQRFQCLPEFRHFSVDELLKYDIKRKHALAVIAAENGFQSWSDFKIQIHFIVGGYLNSWFSNYVEAKAQQHSEGGFLLPYKTQFFICHEDYLRQIGFDPEDPDWKKIGYDWVLPLDQIAWCRLFNKWMQARGNNNEKKIPYLL